LQKHYRKVPYIKGLIKKNAFGIFLLKRSYIFLGRLVFRFAAIAIIAIYKLLKIGYRVFIFKIFFYNALDLNIKIFFLIKAIIKKIADFLANKASSFCCKLLLLFISKLL